MTCRSREELVALLDGALAPPALAAAREHVAECGACRAELARLEAGVSALRAGSPALEPSPLFETRLAARLAAEPPRPRGLLRLLGILPLRPWPLAAGAAAVALAAGLAAWLALAPRAREVGEVAMAEQLELLEELEVVASVGEVESVEDAAVVAMLDQLSPREGRP